MMRVCAKCGGVVAADMKFCPHCGQMMSKAVEPQQPPVRAPETPKAAVPPPQQPAQPNRVSPPQYAPPVQPAPQPVYPPQPAPQPQAAPVYQPAAQQAPPTVQPAPQPAVHTQPQVYQQPPAQPVYAQPAPPQQPAPVYQQPPSQPAYQQPQPPVYAQPPYQRPAKPPKPPRPAGSGLISLRGLMAKTAWIKPVFLMVMAVVVLLLSLFGNVKYQAPDLIGELSAGSEDPAEVLEVNQSFFQVMGGVFALGMSEESAAEYMVKFQEDATKVMEDAMKDLNLSEAMDEEKVIKKMLKAMSKLNLIKYTVAANKLADGDAKNDMVGYMAGIYYLALQVLLELGIIIACVAYAVVGLVNLLTRKAQSKYSAFLKLTLALSLVALFLFSITPHFGAGGCLIAVVTLLIVSAALTAVWRYLGGEIAFDGRGMIKTGVLCAASFLVLFLMCGHILSISVLTVSELTGKEGFTHLANRPVAFALEYMLSLIGMSNVSTGETVSTGILVYGSVLYYIFMPLLLSLCVSLTDRLVKGEFRYDKLQGRLITALVLSILFLGFTIVSGSLEEDSMTIKYAAAPIYYVALVLIIGFLVFRGVFKSNSERLVPPPRQIPPAPFQQ